MTTAKYVLTEKREFVLRSMAKLGEGAFTSYDLANTMDGVSPKSVGMILNRGLEPYGYVKLAPQGKGPNKYFITEKGKKFAGYNRTPERGIDMVGDIAMTAQEILQRNADNNIPEPDLLDLATMTVEKADPIASGSVRALLSNIVVHMHEMHTNIQKLRAILEG